MALPAGEVLLVVVAEAHKNDVAFEAGVEVLQHVDRGHDHNAREVHEDVAAAVEAVGQDHMTLLVVGQAEVDQDTPLVGEGRVGVDLVVEAEVDRQRQSTYRVRTCLAAAVEDLLAADTRPAD